MDELDKLFLEIEHAGITGNKVLLCGFEYEPEVASACIAQVYGILNREYPITTFDTLSEYCDKNKLIVEDYIDDFFIP